MLKAAITVQGKALAAPPPVPDCYLERKLSGVNHQGFPDAGEM